MRYEYKTHRLNFKNPVKIPNRIGPEEVKFIKANVTKGLNFLLEAMPRFTQGQISGALYRLKLTNMSKTWRQSKPVGHLYSTIMVAGKVKVKVSKLK